MNREFRSFGRDTAAVLLDCDTAPEVVAFGEVDRAVWYLAVSHLRVRINDVHAPGTYGIDEAIDENRTRTGALKPSDAVMKDVETAALRTDGLTTAQKRC